MSYVGHLFLRHRDPDCLLLSRVCYNICTIVIHYHFLHVIHSLINYISIFDREVTEIAFQNASYMSLSLLVSTFIYGRTPANLSLVDGLIVSFLPHLINIRAMLNPFIILRGTVTLQVAYIMHLVAMNAFGLTVWRHVDTYGTSPGCNLNSTVKFVVFGHSLAATNKGLRTFATIYFAFCATPIPFFASALVIRLLYRDSDSDLDSDSDSDSDSDLVSNLSLGLDMVSMHLICSIWVYDVVTIEQIIGRNGFSHATSQWTYSQTFAVVLMLGSVIDLVSALGGRMRE